MAKSPTYSGGGSPEIIGDKGGTSSPTSTLGEAVSDSSAVEVAKTTSILALDFGLVNVTTGMSASQLYRMNPGSTSQANQVGVLMPYRGSLAAISWKSNAAKTAGTCTLIPYIDGAASTFTAVWADGTTGGYANASPDIGSFEAGATVDVRVTTDGSMAPTTNDVIVTLFVFINPQAVL